MYFHFALFYSDFVVWSCSCTLYILYCIFGSCNCTKKSMILFKMWHVIGWHPNCTTSHCFLSLGHVLFVWSLFTLVCLLVFDHSQGHAILMVLLECTTCTLVVALANNMFVVYSFNRLFFNVFFFFLICHVACSCKVILLYLLFQLHSCLVWVLLVLPECVTCWIFV